MLAPPIATVQLDRAFWTRQNKVGSLELLVARRLVSGARSRLKVLGRGEVGKALTVHAHKFSGKAAEKIAAAGGTAEAIA